MRNSSKDDLATSGDTSAGDVLPSNSSVYSKGEKILAYHDSLIYEAEMQKAALINMEWRYFVRYFGLNKSSWVEWVGEDRLLKHTEENVMKQKALDEKHIVDKRVKSKRSNQTKGKNVEESKGKKRKHNSGVEKVCVTIEELIEIQIPATLKEQLVDDWNFVVEQDKLVELPRSPTVDEILTMYLDYKTKMDSREAISVGEILRGIRRCFDRVLPMALLYTKERKQYSETVAGRVSPSTIYGAEHLLRLFVKLPKLLPFTSVQDETLNYMQQKTLHHMQEIFLDFLKYLERGRGTFFLSTSNGTNVSDEKSKKKEE